MIFAIQSVFTLLLAFSLGQVYYFLARYANWFPFGFEPVFPSINWLIVSSATFTVSILVSLVLFSKLAAAARPRGRQQ